MSEQAERYADLAKQFERHYPLKKGGTTLTYITGEQAITRLNEVLGYDGWSFDILEHGHQGDDYWVRGRLSIHSLGCTITREQFGGVRNASMELADGLKGAATDALKKCATLIGVGLYLTDKEEHIAAGPAATAEKPVAPAPTRQAAPAASTKRTTPAAPPAQTPADEAARTVLNLPPETAPTPISSEPKVVSDFYDACQAALRLDRVAVLARLKTNSLKEALAARGFPNSKAGLFQLYDTLALIVDDEQHDAHAEAVQA